MKKSKLICTLMITAILLNGCNFMNKNIENEYVFNNNIENNNFIEFPEYKIKSFTNDIAVIAPMDNIDYLSANGFDSELLICRDNNEALISVNAFKQIYPASLTKMMTALLTIENCNLDDEITIDYDITFSDPQASRMGLMIGDTITVRELLYSLMICSANDSAIVLAIHIAGSVEAFADLMNKRALELGATHTHFVNPNGLHDENHYTTPYDLYLVFNKLIDYEDFRELSKLSNYTISYNNYLNEPVYLEIESTNYYLSGYRELPENITVIGGKTGTTDEAGSCLMMCFTNKDGEEYISLVTNANDKIILYEETSIILNISNKVYQDTTSTESTDNSSSETLNNESDEILTDETTDQTIDTETDEITDNQSLNIN